MEGSRSQADAAFHRAAPLPKTFAGACRCGDAKGAGAPPWAWGGCRWVRMGEQEAGDPGGPSDPCKFKKARVKAQHLTKHCWVPLNM